MKRFSVRWISSCSWVYLHVVSWIVAASRQGRATPNCIG